MVPKMAPLYMGTKTKTCAAPAVYFWPHPNRNTRAMCGTSKTWKGLYSCILTRGPLDIMLLGFMSTDLLGGCSNHGQPRPTDPCNITNKPTRRCWGHSQRVTKYKGHYWACEGLETRIESSSQESIVEILCPSTIGGMSPAKKNKAAELIAPACTPEASLAGDPSRAGQEIAHLLADRIPDPGQKTAWLRKKKPSFLLNIRGKAAPNRQHGLRKIILVMPKWNKHLYDYFDTLKRIPLEPTA